MKRNRTFITLCGTLLFVAACSESKQPLNPSDAGEVCDPTVYPCGPYGTTPGTVIRNISLIGRKAGTSPGDPTVKIRFSDYFGQGLKALVVTTAAGWCAPCKQEQPSLVTLYNDYAGEGMGLLEAMIETSKVGTPADIASMDQWATSYHVNFDIAIDPGNELAPYYDINAFPMQMVIRASDMTIMWQNNGLAAEELRTQVEKLLAAQ